MATHEIVSEDLIKRRLSHGPASATLERGGVILRSSSEQLIQDGSEPYTETDMFILLIAEEDKLGGFPNDNAYINDAREYRDNPAAQNLLISCQTRIINQVLKNMSKILKMSCRAQSHIKLIFCNRQLSLVELLDMQATISLYVKCFPSQSLN
jgi:hypothetical protein